MLGDLFRPLGEVVGVVFGTVVGLSAAVVAEGLDITTAMAQEAMDAGCETYDEVREFFKE